MNEKDILAFADNFVKGIKGKKIFHLNSQSEETKKYATLKIKVYFTEEKHGN